MPPSFQSRLNYRTAEPDRQSFHHARTSLGAAGHWIKTLGILSPLVIVEAVKDPEKRSRAICASAVATALLSEALWTHRLTKEREEREARRKECENETRR